MKRSVTLLLLLTLCFTTLVSAEDAASENVSSSSESDHVEDVFSLDGLPNDVEDSTLDEKLLPTFKLLNRHCTAIVRSEMRRWKIGMVSELFKSGVKLELKAEEVKNLHKNFCDKFAPKIPDCAQIKLRIGSLQDAVKESVGMGGKPYAAIKLALHIGTRPLVELKLEKLVDAKKWLEEELVKMTNALAVPFVATGKWMKDLVIKAKTQRAELLKKCGAAAEKMDAPKKAPQKAPPKVPTVDAQTETTTKKTVETKTEIKDDDDKALSTTEKDKVKKYMTAMCKLLTKKTFTGTRRQIRKLLSKQIKLMIVKLRSDFKFIKDFKFIRRYVSTCYKRLRAHFKPTIRRSSKRSPAYMVRRYTRHIAILKRAIKRLGDKRPKKVVRYKALLPKLEAKLKKANAALKAEKSKKSKHTRKARKAKRAKHASRRRRIKHRLAIVRGVIVRATAKLAKTKDPKEIAKFKAMKAAAEAKEKKLKAQLTLIPKNKKRTSKMVRRAARRARRRALKRRYRKKVQKAKKKARKLSRKVKKAKKVAKKAKKAAKKAAKKVAKKTKAAKKAKKTNKTAKPVVKVVVQKPLSAVFNKSPVIREIGYRAIKQAVVQTGAIDTAHWTASKIKLSSLLGQRGFVRSVLKAPQMEKLMKKAVARFGRKNLVLGIKLWAIHHLKKNRVIRIAKSVATKAHKGKKHAKHLAAVKTHLKKEVGKASEELIEHAKLKRLAKLHTVQAGLEAKIKAAKIKFTPAKTASAAMTQYKKMYEELNNLYGQQHKLLMQRKSGLLKQRAEMIKQLQQAQEDLTKKNIEVMKNLREQQRSAEIRKTVEAIHHARAIKKALLNSAAGKMHKEALIANEMKHRMMMAEHLQTELTMASEKKAQLLEKQQQLHTEQARLEKMARVKASIAADLEAQLHRTDHIKKEMHHLEDLKSKLKVLSAKQESAVRVRERLVAQHTASLLHQKLVHERALALAERRVLIKRQKLQRARWEQLMESVKKMQKVNLKRKIAIKQERILLLKKKHQALVNLLAMHKKRHDAMLKYNAIQAVHRAKLLKEREALKKERAEHADKLQKLRYQRRENMIQRRWRLQAQEDELKHEVDTAKRVKARDEYRRERMAAYQIYEEGQNAMKAAWSNYSPLQTPLKKPVVAPWLKSYYDKYLSSYYPNGQPPVQDEEQDDDEASDDDSADDDFLQQVASVRKLSEQRLAHVNRKTLLTQKMHSAHLRPIVKVLFKLRMRILNRMRAAQTYLVQHAMSLQAEREHVEQDIAELKRRLKEEQTLMNTTPTARQVREFKALHKQTTSDWERRSRMLARITNILNLVNAEL